MQANWSKISICPVDLLNPFRVLIGDRSIGLEEKLALKEFEEHRSVSYLNVNINEKCICFGLTERNYIFKLNIIKEFSELVVGV